MPQPVELCFFMSPELEFQIRERTLSHFFKGPGRWKTIYGGAGWYPSLVHRRLRQIKRLLAELNLPAGARALDAGCGCGIYTEHLLRCGLDVSACDASDEMLAETLARVGDVKGSLDLRAALVEALPYPDGVFDVVLCIGVLGYLADRQAAAAELARVTRPGGHVIIAYWNSHTPLRRLRSATGDLLHRLGLKGPRPPALGPNASGVVHHRLSPRDVMGLFAPRGLVLRRHVSCGFSPRLLQQVCPRPAVWWSRAAELTIGSLPGFSQMGEFGIQVWQKPRQPLAR